MKRVLWVMLAMSCGTEELQVPLIDVDQGCVSSQWLGDVPVQNTEECDDLRTNAVTPDGFCVVLPTVCLPKDFEPCEALEGCCAGDVAPCRDF